MKEVPADKKKSLGKLPTPVRNKMGYMKKGGKVKASSASSRGDGIAQRGKTRGRMV